MEKLQHIRTRRHLFRLTAVGAASIPFLTLGRNSASAQATSPLISPFTPKHCLLKGTKILTPSGDCLVQELQIGDEVLTLTGPKTIKWIGYNKFTKEESRAWQ